MPLQSDLDRFRRWAPRERLPACSAASSVLFPLARLIVLVPILFLPFFFEVPAVVFVGVWFLLQLLQGTVELLIRRGGGVAWWAHIGGFVAGLVLGPLLRRSERSYRAYYADEGILGFDTGDARERTSQ